MVGPLNVVGCQHRHKEQGHKQGCQQGVHHGQREIAKQLTSDAVHKGDGQKHTHGGQGGCDDGPSHLAGALYCCRDSVCSLLSMHMDVLEDDDRIVDQHADTQRETAEAHQVEAHAADVHGRKGHDDRERNGGGDDQRGPDVSQEQEQDGDGQKGAHHGRAPEVAEAGLDEACLILKDLHVDAFRESILDARRPSWLTGVALAIAGQSQPILDGSREPNDVCVGGLKDLQLDGFVPI